MYKKTIFLLLCISIGFSTGCNRKAEENNMESIQQSPMENEAESIQSSMTEEEKVKESHDVKEDSFQTNARDSADFEILDNTPITYQLPEGLETWELDNNTKELIVRSIKYIANNWDEAVSNNVSLSNIMILISDSNEAKAFRLDYLHNEQSDDEFHFHIGLTYDGKLQIIKFSNGPGLGKEDIPIVPEIP